MYEFNGKMSLYDLSLMLFYDCKNENNYKEALLKFGIDINDEKMLNEIELKCKNLGVSGWVVSPYVDIELYNNFKYIDYWKQFIDIKDESKIECFFTDNDYALLKYLFGIINIEIITFDCYKYAFWFSESIKNFFDKRYVSCAMVLSAIFEGIIRNCPIDKWRRSIIKFYEETTQKEMHSTKEIDYSNKFAFFIIRHYLFSSIDGFIYSFYHLEKENQFGIEGNHEPSTLTRDWLMHGMTNRTISQTDCIKLFNAIASFLAIKTHMCGT